MEREPAKEEEINPNKTPTVASPLMLPKMEEKVPSQNNPEACYSNLKNERSQGTTFTLKESTKKEAHTNGNGTSKGDSTAESPRTKVGPKTGPGQSGFQRILTGEAQQGKPCDTEGAPENQDEHPINQRHAKHTTQQKPPWTPTIIIILALYIFVNGKVNNTAKEDQRKSRQTVAAPTCKERNKKNTEQPSPSHRVHTSLTAGVRNTESPSRPEVATGESRAKAQSLDRGYTPGGRSPASPAVKLSVAVTWCRQPPRRQLTEPHLPLHKDSTTHAFGGNTRQSLWAPATAYGQQITNPRDRAIGVCQGEPTNPGTSKPTPEETNQEMENRDSKLEKREDNPTEKNEIIERTTGAVMTSGEDHYENMETINTLMSRINLEHKNPGNEWSMGSAEPTRGQPPHRARQADKDRRTQEPYRTKWAPVQHSRDKEIHSNLTNNDLANPRHPYHSTWRKWNPEHKAPLDIVRNPRGPPRKPLNDWNDAQPEEIGLGSLNVGLVDNAYFPRQTVPAKGRGNVSCPNIARHGTTTRQLTVAHPPRSRRTNQMCDGYALFPNQDTRRLGKCDPIRTRYGQAIKGREFKQWWSMQSDLPLSWRRKPVESPTSPTGILAGQPNAWSPSPPAPYLKRKVETCIGHAVSK